MSGRMSCAVRLRGWVRSWFGLVRSFLWVVWEGRDGSRGILVYTSTHTRHIHEHRVTNRSRLATTVQMRVTHFQWANAGGTCKT